MNMPKENYTYEQIAGLNFTSTEKRLLMLVSLVNRGMPILGEDTAMVCDILNVNEDDLSSALRELQTRQADIQ
jgi:hypothetical protein